MILDYQENVRLGKILKWLKSKNFFFYRILKNEHYESINDVDFKLIKNGRDENENRERLIELLNLIDIYKVWEFRELCNKIITNLSNEQGILMKKNAITEEFINEIKSKKKVDYDEYYQNYLNKKRIQH